jgi:hypothetical protein
MGKNMGAPSFSVHCTTVEAQNPSPEVPLAAPPNKNSPMISLNDRSLSLLV